MFLYFLVKNVALNTNRTPGGPSAPGVIHKRCATFISYCGIRRITTKVKTEQARNHGSYFAYARLIARVTLNLHCYDNAAVIGVHAADAAGVHDQAIFELYLIRKKLFDGLGAVRCITMGDHQCAVFGVSDFL